VEIAGKLKRGEQVTAEAIYTNLDMIRLHVAVYEKLFEGRRGEG
jgi:hypothetical protein